MFYNSSLNRSDGWMRVLFCRSLDEKIRVVRTNNKRQKFGEHACKSLDRRAVKYTVAFCWKTHNLRKVLPDQIKHKTCHARCQVLVHQT